MLPNVLPHSTSDHTPVLADEVRELLAVSPGEKGLRFGNLVERMLLPAEQPFVGVPQRRHPHRIVAVQFLDKIQKRTPISPA